MDYNIILLHNLLMRELVYHKPMLKKFNKPKTKQHNDYKNYKKTHKDEYVIYNRRYYLKNKQKWADKYTCSCGKTIALASKPRHEKNNKHHLTWISEQANHDMLLD